MKCFLYFETLPPSWGLCRPNLSQDTDYGIEYAEDDVGRIEAQYDFRFPEDMRAYYALYPQGWMDLGGPDVKVPGSVLSTSDTDMTDLWTILHCGTGPRSIAEETASFRQDYYLNDGWADDHIVFGVNSNEHPFTVKIRGPQYGHIFFFDMWKAGANQRPSDHFHHVAPSFEALITGLKPVEGLD